MNLLTVAHRGASGRLPENTPEAFAEAVRVGADAIEFDVRLAADGRLVVVHDETLERTHRRPERVEETPSAVLARLGVPLLDDVLDRFGVEAVLDVEVKTFGRTAAMALARTLRRHPLREGWFVTSFDRATTEGCAAAGLPVGVLFSRPLGDEVSFGRGLCARALVVRHTAATPDLLDAARRACLPVWVWNLDEEAEIERFARAGVAAVCSNFPERVVAVRGRLA